MRLTAEEIANTIKDAMLNDTLKKKLIIEVATARLKLSDMEFNEFFGKIKEKIVETERTLN